jgi:hypothetical protein
MQFFVLSLIDSFEMSDRKVMRKSRCIPADVPVIHHDGWRYSVMMNILQATPLGEHPPPPATGSGESEHHSIGGREPWSKEIYPIIFNPNREKDVQLVYIIELRVVHDGRKLLMKNERKKRFLVLSEMNKEAMMCLANRSLFSN